MLVSPLIKKIQGILLGALLGVVAGALLILTHNVYPPFGIICSLAGFLALSLLVRSYLAARLAYLFYVVAVVVLILIAATPRASEFLIQGNREGYLLILGGPIAALIPLLKRVPTK